MKRLISDTWFPEIFFISFSWAIFVAMVVLLREFDQKPVFNWHEIGLNAVVSTLSTASKSSLLFVISSCIGQWTYVLFSRHPGSVMHFETHDSASRGPWGSVVLLWRHRRRLYKSPPAFGAALVVLSLFVDPFFQQVIALGERQTSRIGNAVQIPRAARYARGMEVPRFGLTTDTIETLADFSMQAAIRSGLTSERASVKIDARCPSTTCEWETYKTLAVCSKCVDVTESIKKETVNYERHTPQVLQLRGTDDALMLTSGDVDFYYLPNGLYMERQQIFDMELDMIISSTFNTSDTVSFRNQSNLLWSFSMMKMSSNSSENPYTASECALSLCMQEVRSSSENGVVEEQYSEIDVPILQQSLLSAPGNKTNDNDTDPEEGHFVTTTAWPRQDLIFEGNFSIPQISINSIAHELHSLFYEDINKFEYNDIESHRNGTFGSGMSKTPRRIPTGYYISISDGSGTKYRPSPMQVLHSVSDLPSLFRNLAASITNNMRLNDEAATLALGTSAVVVYKIRWVYIILPAVSTLGGSVFLLLSAVYTRRLGAPLWKSSAVAILKCGATLQGFARGESKISGIEGAAKEVSFELVRPGDMEASSTVRVDTKTGYATVTTSQDFTLRN